MILSLNIPDDKVPFIMELLQGFSYIQAEPKNINFTSNNLINNQIDIMKYVKSMRSFTIEDLVREQNYQGFDAAKFRELADIIDIKDEPFTSTP